MSRAFWKTLALCAHGWLDLPRRVRADLGGRGPGVGPGHRSADHDAAVRDGDHHRPRQRVRIAGQLSAAHCLARDRVRHVLDPEWPRRCPLDLLPGDARARRAARVHAPHGVDWRDHELHHHGQESATRWLQYRWDRVRQRAGDSRWPGTCLRPSRGSSSGSTSLGARRWGSAAARKGMGLMGRCSR